MKKIFLIITLFTMAIVNSQTIYPAKVKVTGNVTSPSAPFVNVQETDGFVNKINKFDLQDIITYSAASALPITGTVGKLYYVVDTFTYYEWRGTTYEVFGNGGGITGVGAGNNVTIDNTNPLVPIVSANVPTMLEFNETDKTVWNNGKQNLPSNTSFGDLALKSNTIGTSATAIGYEALSNNTTAINNTGIGYFSLKNNTIGGWNTALGSESLLFNTTGNNNVAVGYTALTTNTTGGQNVAVGRQAMTTNTTGSWNTAIGQTSLTANVSNSYNTALGGQSLQQSTGSSNTGIGFSSLLNTTTGGFNTALGGQSFKNNTTGNFNTSLGYDAGSFIFDSATPTTIANNSVFVGAYSKPLGSNETNQIVIGHNAIGEGSNTVTIGNTSIIKSVIYGKLKLPTTPTTVTPTTEKMLVWDTISKEVEIADIPTSGGSTSDATTTIKGAVKLAGDLGGTADLPTVPGLANKANDADVVHKTGDETINGSKTFNQTIITSNGIAVPEGGGNNSIVWSTDGNSFDLNSKLDVGSYATFLNGFTTLTTTGIFTTPVNITTTTLFEFEIIGAGGGGGGSNNVSGGVASGGSGAGYCFKRCTGLTPNTNYSYTIGIGGLGGAGSTNGTAGSSSSITINNITYSATGGGLGRTGALVGSDNAGIGINGDLNLNGEYGGASTSSGSTSSCGKGGNSPKGWGYGGNEVPSGANGANGVNYGGGGSAGRGTNIQGGNGSNGIIVVRWYN